MNSGFYCYVCGKEIKGEYYLVSMKSPTDKVFLFGTECIDRIDNEDYVTKVKEIK